MSRRTKLIILAIFLVLLAIPVVYIVLTWSTPDPLRVRVLPGVHTTPFVGLARHQVAVENVSGSSLRVYVFHEDTSSTPRSPNIYQMLPRMKRLELWRQGRTPIPPHGTGHMELYREHTTPDSDPPDQFLCVYASAAKDLTIRFLNWFYLHSPAFVREFIPEVQPDFYYGPLESAP